MVSELLKSGEEINMTVGDASFKVSLEEQSRKDGLKKIEVPLEWKDAVKDLEIGSKCILTSENEEHTFIQYRTILVEKQLEQLCPILLLKPDKELKKHSEFRHHNRVNAFVFTMFSAEDDVDLDISKEKSLHGTISDISIGGCLLMSEQSLNVSDHIWLVLSIRDEPSIKIKCQIKSRRKSHIEKCYFNGLEFIELSRAETEMIRSYIKDPDA